MSAKGILVLCAQALLIQLAFSQCVGRGNLGAGLDSCGFLGTILHSLGAPSYAGPGIAAPACAAPGLGCNSPAYGAELGYGAGLEYSSGLPIEVIPTSGGSLHVTSCSSIAPTGLSIVSENVLEGYVLVTGELPFLSAVALDGVLPSGGAGAVSYSLGNGVTVIESIIPSAAATAPAAAAYGPSIGNYSPITATSRGALPASASGCNAAAIMSPIGGCGCGGLGGYPNGIYY